MKLPQLKALTYNLWLDLVSINGAVVQDNAFKPEVRVFGDLRRRVTWEKALIRFYSQVIYDCCLDAHTLVLHSLNFQPGDRLYEYRHRIFAAFLALPDSLDLLKAGLEQVFQTTDFTPQEQQEARKNGFFELVREQATGGRLSGQPAQFIGELRGVGSATTG